jgi:hypothetical protein
MTDTRAATLGKAVVYDTHSDTSVATLAKAVVYATHNDARVATLGKIVVYSTQAIPPDPNTPAPILPGAQRTTLYLCEAIGARIIAFGIGASQIGDDYQFELETWDFIPSGEVGDNLFRSINVALRHTGSFTLGVTPIVDGVDLAEQVFSRAGSGETTCQALVQARGARCAARIRTIARGGDLEIENLSATFVGIRVFP